MKSSWSLDPSCSMTPCLCLGGSPKMDSTKNMVSWFSQIHWATGTWDCTIISLGTLASDIACQATGCQLGSIKLRPSCSEGPCSVSRWRLCTDASREDIQLQPLSDLSERCGKSCGIVLGCNFFPTNWNEVLVRSYFGRPIAPAIVRPKQTHSAPKKDGSLPQAVVKAWERHLFHWLK